MVFHNYLSGRDDFYYLEIMDKYSHQCVDIGKEFCIEVVPLYETMINTSVIVILTLWTLWNRSLWININIYILYAYWNFRIGAQCSTMGFILTSMVLNKCLSCFGPLLRKESLIFHTFYPIIRSLRFSSSKNLYKLRIKMIIFNDVPVVFALLISD